MAVHLLDPMTGLTLECELLETTLMDGKTYGSMTPIDAPVTIATLDKANGELIELEARWHMSTHFCHVSHSILLHVDVSSPYIYRPHASAASFHCMPLVNLTTLRMTERSKMSCRPPWRRSTSSDFR